MENLLKPQCFLYKLNFVQNGTICRNFINASDVTDNELNDFLRIFFHEIKTWDCRNLTEKQVENRLDLTDEHPGKWKCVQFLRVEDFAPDCKKKKQNLVGRTYNITLLISLINGQKGGNDSKNEKILNFESRGTDLCFENLTKFNLTVRHYHLRLFKDVDKMTLRQRLDILYDNIKIDFFNFFKLEKMQLYVPIQNACPAVAVIDLDDTITDENKPTKLLNGDLTLQLLRICRKLFDRIVLWSFGRTSHVVSTLEYHGLNGFFDSIISFSQNTVEKKYPCKGFGYVKALLNERFDIHSVHYAVLFDDRWENNVGYDRHVLLTKHQTESELLGIAETLWKEKNEFTANCL